MIVKIELVPPPPGGSQCGINSERRGSAGPLAGEVTRRAALRVMGAGAAAAVAACEPSVPSSGTGSPATSPTVTPPVARSPIPSPPQAQRGPSPIAAENTRRGSSGWRMGAGGSRPADDLAQQIKGFTSSTSVAHAERLSFFVTVAPAQDYTIAIYRLGYYGGQGARLVTTSPKLAGRAQPTPELESATGLVSCPWSATWSLEIPHEWTSGVYLAVFTNAQRYRSYVPFVVRDEVRAAEFLAVMGFSTYQAYNEYPLDGRLGRSLYFGYDLRGGGRRIRSARAREVSFDRPYANDGLPRHFQRDHSAIAWMERNGYNTAYACSRDLHSGRVATNRYRALVFPSHDEYWSPQMRQTVEEALRDGRHLAFLSANNIYWNVRFAPTMDRPDNTLVCYRDDPDPRAGPMGPTRRWRDIGHAEQGLLGVQYRAIVPRPSPLVVRNPGHWFWAGTGLAAGDSLPLMVEVEADGLAKSRHRPDGGHQTLLSASPFRTRDGRRIVQNSSLYESDSGALVFVAGTFGWTPALNRRARTGQQIGRATANLFDRLRQG